MMWQSEDAFGGWLIIAVLLIIITLPIITYIYKRRGVDVTSHRFLLSVGALLVIPLLIVPLWVTDISIKYKVGGTIVGLAVGLGDYFLLDRLQKKLRKKII